MSDAVKPPQSIAIMKQFMETQDLRLLKKPIAFPKADSDFANWLCCQAGIVCMFTGGLTACLCPIVTFCPSKLVPTMELQLDEHSVQLFDATNDCCCHIQMEKQTVPLDKIQDVQVGQGCVETCFGVKVLTILTGGAGNQGAAFLQNPDEARAAIMLAVRMRGNSGVITQNSMDDSGQGSLAQRLQNLKKLEEKGVLTAAEVSSVRVQVLAAEQDPTAALLEASQLRDAGTITAAEFQSLKGLLLARLRTP